MRGPTRRPHISLAIISVTVQLWTQVFWVISVYFSIRNTLPKSGTFLLGHPVYRPTFINKVHSSSETIRFSALDWIPLGLIKRLLYVVQEASAKFGLQAGTKKLGKQREGSSVPVRAHYFLLALPLPRSSPIRYKYPTQSIHWHTSFTCLWRWNRQWVPKRRQLELRRRGITQKATNCLCLWDRASSW